MAQLTKMQQKIYDYIVQAIQDQGYPPSVREIGEAVGLKSPVIPTNWDAMMPPI